MKIMTVIAGISCLAIGLTLGSSLVEKASAFSFLTKSETGTVAQTCPMANGGACPRANGGTCDGGCAKTNGGTCDGACGGVRKQDGTGSRAGAATCPNRQIQ